MQLLRKKRVPLKNKFNFIILDIKDDTILAVSSFKGMLKLWNLLSLVDDDFQISERRRFESKVPRWYKDFGISNIEKNFPRTSHLFPPDMHAYVCVSGSWYCWVYEKILRLCLMDDPSRRQQFFCLILVFARFTPNYKNLMDLESIHTPVNSHI